MKCDHMSPVKLSCVFQVFIWVLNDEREYRRAFELGADGVMTDFPRKLRTFLDRNPQFPLTKARAAAQT